MTSQKNQPDAAQPLTVGEFVADYSNHIHDDPLTRKIRKLSVQGTFAEFKPEMIKHHSELAHYAGQLRSEQEGKVMSLGLSFHDIVSDPESLFGKDLIVTGLTSRYHIALYNLETITKVEVLNGEGDVVETYNANEQSNAKLKDYFDRMGYEIPS